MSVQRMPNGQYVEIADGTPPEVVARIRARYAPARTAAPAARAETPRPSENRRTGQRYSEAELARRVASASDPLGNIPIIGNINRGVNEYVHQATLHLNDVLAPAAIAGTRALRGGNFRQEYSAEQEAMRSQRNRERERSPLATGVGGLAGMVAAPIPGFGRAAEAGLASVSAARGGLNGAGRAASAVLRGARGQVGGAAATGATQAGLSTLIDTNGNVGDALQSAAFGGALGAGAGALVKGGTGLYRAFKDRAPEQAERLAYDKIAALLGRARTEGGRVMTPERATREIAVAGARGTPMTVGDLSNEAANMRGSLARETNLPYANTAADRASSRLGGVPDRFETELRRRLPTTGDNMDAVLTRGAVRQGQQIQGGIDYARGGALDKPLAPTRLLRRAVFERPTSTMRTVLDDVRTMFADDPKLGPMTVKVLRKGKEYETLTTRAYDLVRREYGGRITTASPMNAAGVREPLPLAERLSRELRELDAQVRRANKPYAATVERQRDSFEQVDALNVGNKFISQMGTRPRELLANITAKGVKNAEEIRIGVGDALRTMRHNKGGQSAIKLLRAWQDNPDQRAVLVHIMGGQKQFNRFAQSMRRELSTMRSDAATLRGSNNPNLNHFAEHGEAPIARGVLETLRGGAFGGILGAGAQAARAVGRTAQGMGPAARDATLRLLDSDGRGLAEGVAQARAVREARRQAAVARARAAGKIAGSAAASRYGE